MHVAIIMDGNGRWAAAAALPRTAGHIEGARHRAPDGRGRRGRRHRYADAVCLLVRQLGPPAREVRRCSSCSARYLLTETERCVAQQVRLNIIGRRDRLGPALLRAVEHGERQTAQCTGMHLRMAVDYSARHSILQAAARRRCSTPAAAMSSRSFAPAQCGEPFGPGARRGPADPHRRRQRLSDFLLWECAYAELYFIDRAVAGFRRRGPGSRAGGLLAAGSAASARWPSPLTVQAQAQT